MRKLNQLFKEKKFDEIITITKTYYLKKDFKNESIINFYGLALQSIGKIKRSVEVFTELYKNNNNNYGCINNLANSYYILGDYKSAEFFFKKSILINPKFSPSYFNLKKIKIELGETKEAVAILLQAIDHLNNNEKIPIIFEIARIYRAIGNFKLAKDYINKILLLNKNDSSAHKFLSSIIDYKKDSDGHLIQLERISKSTNLSEEDRINIYFALGKAYEEILDYVKSASFYKEANLISKKNSNYLMYELVKFIEDIKLVFNQIDYSKVYKPISSKRVIFICGMPRSGSTLVEQILSSHNQVLATGENNFLSNIFNKYYLNKNELKKNKIISDIKNEGANPQLEYFLNNSIKNSSYKIFTDKTLQNFYWIGYIKLFFPNSVIINTEREIKDNAFSIYKNSFNKSMGWTSDEKDIVDYFRVYKDIMNFWKFKIPNFIYTLRYENLVNDSLQETKNLLKFCDLEFDNNCLEFYKNKNAVFTTSTVQVRNKISVSSVNSYKKYYLYLRKFFDSLDKL